MKTTVEIADSLLAEAKALAESGGIPLRQVIEDGLRAVIRSQPQRSSCFKLRDASFGGRQRQPDLSWRELRRAIYEGRGE